MKIAAISASKVPSTTANSIQVMKACQAFIQMGHEVTLFVPHHEEAGADFNKLANLYGLEQHFQIEWLPAKRIFRRYDFSFTAARKARRLGVDLVVAWPIQAAFASLLSGIPTILELHGPPEGKIGPTLFRFLLAQPGKKRLVFITNALRKMVERSFQDLEIDRISCVAPNGVELQRYENLPDPVSARKLVGLPEKITAAYSGHLYPGRGMGMLIELAKHFSEVQFIWIGGRTSEVSYWRDRLAAESVTNVSLLGFIPNENLPVYQAAADILLMPYEKVITGSSGGNSASYASPMKMFEYMACKRPILSSDLEVIREVLTPENSILCAPENIPDWIEGMQALLVDKNLRDKLARQAYLDVQNYGWDQRVQKILLDFVNE